MNDLKDRYDRFNSAYLHERRALGDELSEEAHRAIEEVLASRGEPFSARGMVSGVVAESETPWPRRMKTYAKKLEDFLFRPTLGLWAYCLAIVPLALIPSMLLLGLAMTALTLAGLPVRMPAHHPNSPLWIAVTVIGSPLAETALLAVGLWLLGRVIHTQVRLAAASSICWGLLHGMSTPIWFIGTAWSFFVMSAAYLAWRRHSRVRAFIAAAVPHALVNSVAIVMLRALS